MSATSITFASGCCGSASLADSGTWWRIVIGGFLAFNSMTVALAVNLSKVDREQRFILQGIPLCVCLIVGVLLGGPILSGLRRECRARRLTIEALFFLSILGAFLASLISFATGEGPVFFEVVSILLVVYALGRELGRYGQEKVLQALGEWDPSTLTCEVVGLAGIGRHVRVADIQPGERVRVHPGAMIPVDGFVCEGESFVHEASFAPSRRSRSRRNPCRRVDADS